MKRLFRLNVIFGFALVFLLLHVRPDTGAAQETAKVRLKAIRLEGGEMRIDGLLDEPVWQAGEAAGGFVQQQPVTGAAARALSFVRVVYDDQSLYIGAMLHDPDPDAVQADERQRDGLFNRSDAFAVLIDTYHDHQSAFFFESNLLSAVSDALVSQEGAQINRDWDGKWEVLARRTPEGWSVEFRIPFETIRFRPGDAQTWGIQFRRRVPHLKEVSFWNPLTSEQNFFEVSRAGHLDGIEAYNMVRPFSMKPYVKGSYRSSVPGDESSQEERKDQTGTNDRSETDFDGGLDLRYQFRTNLTLDLTYNTDFAETEVDRFQANLTRFPLFFPEKREFFLEGKGFYDFGLSGRVQPFFSRRIGLSQEEVIPILAGGKFSGKAGPYGIGTLLMQTEASGNIPAEQFGVLRLSRDIGLRSNLGLIATKRTNRGGSGHETLGLDSLIAPHPNFTANMFWLHSGGEAESKGNAHFAEVNWRDPFWRIKLNHLRVDEQFDPVLGFVQQSDLDETLGYVDIRPQPASGPIREFGLKTEMTYQRNTLGQFLYQSNYNRIQADFRSGDLILISVDPQRERLPEDFKIRPGMTIRAGDYFYTHSNVILTSDARRPFSGQLDILWGGFYGGRKTSLGLTLTAAPKEGVKIGAGWEVDWVRLPQGDFSAQILSGDLTWSLSNRLLFQGLFQWDKEEDSLAANLRLSWEYREQSWFYLIVNPVDQKTGDSVLILTKLTLRLDP